MRKPNRTYAFLLLVTIIIARKLLNFKSFRAIFYAINLIRYIYTLLIRPLRHFAKVMHNIQRLRR